MYEASYESHQVDVDSAFRKGYRRGAVGIAGAVNETSLVSNKNSLSTQVNAIPSPSHHFISKVNSVSATGSSITAMKNPRQAPHEYTIPTR